MGENGMEVTKELESVCRSIAARVQEFMKSEENRKKYEEWYRERYGAKEG